MNNNIIKKNIKEYFEKKDFVDFVLIFGSYATDKNHDISDLDIGVHVKRELSLLEIGTVVSDIEEMIHIEADIIILNDLYKSRPEFVYNIIRDSLPILINANDLFIEYKKYTYLYYMDTDFLRKIVCKSLNKRIQDKKFGESNYAG
jgi:predicted nucleotidyltransferase